MQKNGSVIIIPQINVVVKQKCDCFTLWIDYATLGSNQRDSLKPEICNQIMMEGGYKFEFTSKSDGRRSGIA